MSDSGVAVPTLRLATVVSLETREALEAEAERLGVPVAVVMKIAIREYLDRRAAGQSRDRTTLGV